MTSGGGLDAALCEALGRLAEVPVLLVASDYDGTLAPIVSDPARAVPDPESLAALERLSDLPATHAAIITGRSLKQLAALIGHVNVHTVGSHGVEFGPQFERSLPAEAHALRDAVAADLERIARTAPGFLVEVKPASVAFHYRNADDHAAQHALREVLAGPARRPGILTHHGKRVVELAVMEASKGQAINVLRSDLSPPPDAALYVGDDLTDEKAFAVLEPGRDVGIKVGDGETRAEFRIAGTREVGMVLTHLGEQRAAALGHRGP